jgi:hypothetical protein
VIPANDVEIITLERFPPDFECAMKFKLIYDGPLPTGKGSAAVKQLIRRQLHPQLRQLWRTHPFLNEDPAQIGLIASNFDAFGYQFVPLIRENNYMACRVDMLLLFREQPYGPMLNGDLDNRVKTLIDGLKVPKEKSQTGPEGAGPTEDERPFFVLLQDDALIFEIQIRTDQLLAPKRDGQSARDIVAIIEVHVMNANRTDFFSLSAGFKFRPSS